MRPARCAVKEERAAASRALRRALARAVGACRARSVRARALLVRATHGIGRVGRRRRDHLALRIAVHHMRLACAISVGAGEGAHRTRCAR